MQGKKNILISVGCNKDCATQMDSAKEHLSELFPGITFTDVITSPAYGMGSTAPDYANMLAKGDTTMTLERLVKELKYQEVLMGDSKSLRQRNIVMMDLDLMEYNGERHHHDDWKRPYIKSLLGMLKVIVMASLLGFSVNAFTYASSSLATGMYTTVAEKERKQDAELLGRAMEYYQSGKYHESILAFEKLQKRYRLTARFKAFLGMSYYRERRYEEAVENLKQGIPELKAFSPKEQAVYTYSCAESLFHLERYQEAIDYYNMALPMTECKDQGDVLYHTAFSYFKIEKYEDALNNFQSSMLLYEKYATNPEDSIHKARMAQIKNMVRWLKNTLGQ